MRRILAVSFVALALLGAAPFLLPPAGQRAVADATPTFVVPDADAYGLGDCLREGRDCGRIIAQSWCQAHGFSKVMSFGAARPEDVTASTSTAGRGLPPAVVTCAR
jgi:hypothetical protein